MNKYFSVEDKVGHIIEKYPETLMVFISNGFENLKNENMRKLLADKITFKSAMLVKNKNIEVFEKLLVEQIENTRMLVDTTLNEDGFVKKGQYTVEGVLPCPIRIPLMERIENFVAEDMFLSENLGYDLQSANLGIDGLIEKVEANDEESLPDIMVSAGFELFFDEKLMGKYIGKGVFESSIKEMNKDLSNDYIELIDPEGEYGIMGVVPAVFIVNTEELKGREIPRTWEDLLSEEYENSVALPMRDLDLLNAVLIHIYRFFGEDGIKKLARSYKKSMHPAQMVKGGRNNTPPLINISPYFFSQMISENGPMKMVWPEDGAILSPIFMLCKKSSKDKLKNFEEFLLSEDVGNIFSANGKFPSTSVNVNNNLDEHMKFKWIGWDFIRNNDIGKIINDSLKLFNDIVTE